MTHRYFICVIGRWKIENWHLYHQVKRTSVLGKNNWLAWERVL